MMTLDMTLPNRPSSIASLDRSADFTRENLRRRPMSGGLPFKRIDQTTDVGFHGNLVPVERFGFIRKFPNRWKIVPFGVRADGVILFHELIDDVIQMPFAEQDELVEAFMFDRLDEPLNSSVQIG